MNNIDYNLNNLNEAKGIFAAIIGAVTGMIAWTSIKVYKKVLKTGKSIYLKKYLDSVEEQIVNGTKSDQPDGFNKIINVAKNELINDYKKNQKLLNSIKSELKKSDKNIPSSIRLISNSQESFKRKYINNVKDLMDSLIKQYDSQIIASIDSFNEKYNKKVGDLKKLDGDKLKKTWESYKNNIEDKKNDLIEEFEKSNEFKSLYNLLFGEMNKLKKELEYYSDTENKDFLELQKILIVQPLNAGVINDNKNGPLELNVDYLISSKDFRKNKNITDNYSAIIMTFDKKVYETTINEFNKFYKTNNIDNIIKYVDKIKNDLNNSGQTYTIVNKDTNILLKGDNNGNRFNTNITYHSKQNGEGNIIYKNIPILNRYGDEEEVNSESDNQGNNIYIIGVIGLVNDNKKIYKIFYDGQVYLSNNTSGKYSISFKNE